MKPSVRTAIAPAMVAALVATARGTVRVVADSGVPGPTVLVVGGTATGDDRVSVATRQAGAWRLTRGQLVEADLRDLPSAVRTARPSTLLIISEVGLNPVATDKGRPKDADAPPTVLSRHFDGGTLAADLTVAGGAGAEPFVAAPATADLLTAADAAYAAQEPRAAVVSAATWKQPTATLPADVPLVRVVLPIKSGLTTCPSDRYGLFRRAIFDVLRADHMLGADASPWVLLPARDDRAGRLAVAVCDPASASRSSASPIVGPRNFPALIDDDGGSIGGTGDDHGGRHGVRYAFVGPTDLAHPKLLDQFDAVLVCGVEGNGATLGRPAVDAIRDFVGRGGGYVGTGAGAALAGCGSPSSLHVLNADLRFANTGGVWRTDRVDLRLTAAGVTLFGTHRRPWTVLYDTRAPTFQPGHEAGLPPYTPLATFAANPGGDAAVVSTPYGKGHVVCFAPNPESPIGPDESTELIRHALRWAARRPVDGPPNS